MCFVAPILGGANVAGIVTVQTSAICLPLVVHLWWGSAAMRCSTSHRSDRLGGRVVAFHGKLPSPPLPTQKICKDLSEENQTKCVSKEIVVNEREPSMRPIILASTSPYRQQQLQQLRLPFEAHRHKVDESVAKHSLSSPEEITRKLSAAKAESLGHDFPHALILGGDQIATIDGEILEKPGSREAAQRQLRRLIGRSHDLWSGIALHDPQTGQTLTAVERNIMTMRALPGPQIDAYLDRDQPWDCVGAYKIESEGITLFSSIESHDHTSIVGLPLMQLVNLLAPYDVHLPLV